MLALGAVAVGVLWADSYRPRPMVKMAAAPANTDGAGGVPFTVPRYGSDHTFLISPTGAVRVKLSRGHLAVSYCGYWILLTRLEWAFIVFAAYPAYAIINAWTRPYRRRRRGLCVSCGYDLTGNVSGICSECGRRV
jgi:hypothetical protein